MASSSITRPRRGLLTDEPILLLALVLLALYFAREVLIPLAMAVTLNFLLAPAVIVFERMRLRRVSAVVLVVFMASVLVGGVGFVVSRQLIEVVNDLPHHRSNISSRLGELQSPRTGQLGQTEKSVQELWDIITGKQPSVPTETANPTAEQSGRRAKEQMTPHVTANPQPTQPTPVVVLTPPESTTQYLGELLMPVLKPLGTLGMVLIFTIYMLLKREDLRNRLLLLAGIGRLNLMTQALNEAAERISRYLVMNVLVNAGCGVVVAIGLYLLHVPNATLWGALFAILRLVPYAGSLIAGASTVGYTMAMFPTWWHPFWVFLLFLVLEMAVSNFVEPYLYGSHTGISALALVAMAIVWTLLWGWAGLIVSTPLTVCLIVFGRYVPQMSFLHILLGEEAELAPEAHFYERLLAMDQTEAHNVADRFLETRGLVDLYDEVVMPALIMTEQDRHKGVLDEVRSSYLFQSATELVAELTDYRSPLDPACDPETAARTNPVICIPASDQADEIAATMLAQLLEQCGHKTLMLPSAAVSPEILSRLAEEAGTILCISAVPPFAFAHARTLALRLRQSVPENRIMVGLWNTSGDKDKLRERFGQARPYLVVTTLRDALAQIKECERQVAAAPWKSPALEVTGD
jgi:predicted PurR-regulated permease PerM